MSRRTVTRAQRLAELGPENFHQNLENERQSKYLNPYQQKPSLTSYELNAVRYCVIEK